MGADAVGLVVGEAAAFVDEAEVGGESEGQGMRRAAGALGVAEDGRHHADAHLHRLLEADVDERVADVRERVIVNPWKHLPLDNVHEINRVEVQRLLAVVEAVGADALTPGERTFLDYIMRPVLDSFSRSPRPGLECLKAPRVASLFPECCLTWQ